MCIRDRMKIATIPVGYADGYIRTLAREGSVAVRGQRAKIIGRVCMDQIMTDVTEIANVSRGDEVTLFGTCLLYTSLPAGCHQTASLSTTGTPLPLKRGRTSRSKSAGSISIVRSIREPSFNFK